MNNCPVITFPTMGIALSIAYTVVALMMPWTEGMGRGVVYEFARTLIVLAMLTSPISALFISIGLFTSFHREMCRSLRIPKVLAQLMGLISSGYLVIYLWKHVSLLSFRG